MNCDQFYLELERAIESRSLPSLHLQEHAVTCQESDCRQAWSEYQLLEQAVAEWKDCDETVDLVDQVLRAYRDDALYPEDAPVPSSRQMPVNFGGIAVVVSLVLLLMLTVLRSTPPDEQRERLVANRPAEEPLVEQEIPTAVSGRSAEQLAELGSAYGEFVEDATRRVTETGAFAFLDDEPSAREEPVAPAWLRKWQERLDRPFEPFNVPASDEQSQSSESPSDALT